MITKLLACSAAVVLSSGCSTFSETHYFLQRKTAPEAAENNYYRVRIHGYAAGTSSRYVSGYFDEAAVENYFGESASNPVFPSLPGKVTDKSKTETESPNPKIEPLDSANQGKTLVMLLTTNANAVTSAVQADVIGNNLAVSAAQLAFASEFRDAAAARVAVDRAQTSDNLLRQEVRLNLSSAKALLLAPATATDNAALPPDPAQAKEKIRAAITAIARSMGYSSDIATEEDFIKLLAWLRERVRS